MGFLVFGLIAVFAIAMFGLQIYGMILSFKKHWGIGALALLVPGFGLVVGGLKVCNVDILNNKEAA